MDYRHDRSILFSSLNRSRPEAGKGADKPTTDTSVLFARFPHLQRIEVVWGSANCRALLNGLLYDSRDGDRQGFPPEHAHTIFQLLSEHDRVFPQFVKDMVPFGFGQSGARNANTW